MFPPAALPALPMARAAPCGTPPLDAAVGAEPKVAGDAPQGADCRAGERGGGGGVSSVLLRHLKALHERYGEFAEENGYVRCEDKEVRPRMYDVV